MREILFRGKRKDNGQWVYGNYIKSPVCQDLHMIEDTIPLILDNGSRCFQGCPPVDPVTVGQYTGLTDKNGKKIFEGDIVDASETWWASCGAAGHSSPVIPVKWACDICGFDPFADYDRDCGVYIYGNEVEVIGNIHDNPELLEEVQ